MISLFKCKSGVVFYFLGLWNSALSAMFIFATLVKNQSIMGCKAYALLFFDSIEATASKYTQCLHGGFFLALNGEKVRKSYDEHTYFVQKGWGGSLYKSSPPPKQTLWQWYSLPFLVPQTGLLPFSTSWSFLYLLFHQSKAKSLPFSDKISE